jgi:glycosyltransferase involved in cell wall biosynthesis
MLFASGIIFTSAYEGLPVALLEALAVRVPAFCTDVGDIGLILEEYGCGLTVPCSGDIDEYEQAFDEFLCDLTQYRRNLEINAARILDRFSGESIARRYASVFDKSMNDVSKRTVPRSNFNARGGTDLSQIA